MDISFGITMKRCVLFYFVFSFLVWSKGFTQESNFSKVVSQYETVMQSAARNWVKKKYTRALDDFFLAREVISKNMPNPSESFAWHGSCALKTYTVVMARMVEIDIYRAERDEETVRKITQQAHTWAEILNEQANVWEKVKSQNAAETSLRTRWLSRFQKAIRQTEKLSYAITSKD